jgi:hypothetical protein
MSYHIRVLRLVFFFSISLLGLASHGAMGQNNVDDVYYVANTRPPDAFLALRTNPSTKAGHRIATMPSGTSLKVLQRNGDGWWYVRVLPSGPEGWAMSRQGSVSWIMCCSSDRGLLGQASVEPSPRMHTCIVIDPSPPLNVREAPNGKILSGLERGEKVIMNGGPVMYRGEAWANVTSINNSEVHGWVFKSLIGSCAWETNAYAANADMPTEYFLIYDFRCQVTKIVDDDFVADSTQEVRISWEGGHRRFQVKHFTKLGAVYMRTNQYRDVNWSVGNSPNAPTLSWTGINKKRPNLRMLGVWRAITME